MSEYITLAAVVKEVCRLAEENNEPIYSEKKVREKYLQIFDMMNIDKEKLKDGNDYQLPKESLNFLVSLNKCYSDPNVKKMRKRNFEQACLETMANLLEGFRKMILGLNKSEADKDDMISKMYIQTKYPYLQKRAEILKELKEIELDFCPNYEEDEAIEDELERYMDNNEKVTMMEMHSISRKRRFRYFDAFDDLDINDELLFTSFVLEDIRCMINRHHELYHYISEIRNCEINDAAEQESMNMTKEQEMDAINETNCSIALRRALDTNEEYKDLVAERKQILRSNEFISKVQPRFTAICERLKEIARETQQELWGKVVLHDSQEDDIDFSFRDTSENVLMEALRTYHDNNKDRRDYAKRMEMITDEEWERMKEAIESMLADRKSK